MYTQIRDNTPEFEQLAAMQSGGGPGSVTARRESVECTRRCRLVERFISGNYFQTFGLRSYAGRLVSPADDAPSAPMVAAMSYQAWQRDFASDPSVVGSTFVLNAQPVTITGITPPVFYGDRLTDAPPDFYMPMSMEPVLHPRVRSFTATISTGFT